jgi:hypothetical protein
MDDERLDELEDWVDRIAGSLMEVEEETKRLAEAIDSLEIAGLLIHPDHVDEIAELSSSQVRYV